MKSKELTALRKLERNATTLLEVIQKTMEIRVQLDSEITARDQCAECHDGLREDREALFKRETIKADQLSEIERGITSALDLYKVAHVQIGQLSVREEENIKSIAQLVCVLAKATTLKKKLNAAELRLIDDDDYDI